MFKRIISNFGTKPRSLINITAAAWEKIAMISIQTNINSFLFSADSGGCSGLNFSLQTIASDEINSIAMNSKIPISLFKNKNNTVYVEPLSEMYLIGTTIDYTQDIFESKFVFLPDKDKVSTCGCGTSFHIKE